MIEEFLNHKIWVSRGGQGGKNRGRVRGVPTTVGQLYETLSNPSVDTSINYAEYMKLSLDEKGERKAAPGFAIMAKFRDGKRKGSHFEGKSAVQIDIDNCSPEQAEFILNGSAAINVYSFIWHTTRAHCTMKPRIRIIVPTDRLMDAEEANAITRLLSLRLADDPDEAIEIPDSVSHKVNQIMYLPSISKGQDFLHGINEIGKLLRVDEFLAEHPGWRDISKLPRKDTEKSAAGPSGKKMEDPTEKVGIVGAFCRAYTVHEAIEKFLPEVYGPGDSTDSEERYSYLQGSGANGAVAYEGGKFLTSHHSSDPAEGTHNAFDLVRIHLFGGKDDDAHGNTSPGNMPSFKAMTDFALNDERVVRERAAALAFDDDEFDDMDDEEDDQDRNRSLFSSDELLDMGREVDDFLGISEEDEAAQPQASKKKGKAEKNDSPKWQEQLVLDKADQVEKSKFNAILIVTNDRRIAPSIALNELSGGPDLRGPLRFEKVKVCQAPSPTSGENLWASPEFQDLLHAQPVGRKWTDTDTAALAYCLAAPTKLGGYGRDFTNQDLQQGMLLAAEQNRYNPVIERIELTKWDGKRRIGTFFADYLGAEDNIYHRELAELWFLAAVTRLYEPGAKFDLVPILGGLQGGGKSMLVECLAMGFSGKLPGDFENTQKMVEATRGAWILEVPELKGFHRGQIEDIKQYFSNTSDTVRLAYRVNEQDFPRRCVYMGTTNENEYLRDSENRRFCPVLTTVHEGGAIEFDGPNGVKKVIPQLWAEASVMYHDAREKQPRGGLVLTWRTKEAHQIARRLQTEAREAQPHEAVAEVVEEWLDRPYSAARVDAGDALVDEFEGATDGEVFVRNLVTTTMIREELGGHPVIRDLRINPDKVISQALKSLEGWESLGKLRRLGRQARWYARVNSDQTSAFVRAAPAHRCIYTSMDDLLA